MNEIDTRILREPLTAPGHPPSEGDTRPLGSLVSAASGPFPGDPAAAPLGNLAGSMVGAVLQGTRVSASARAVPHPASTDAHHPSPASTDAHPSAALDDPEELAVRYGQQAYAEHRGACDWTDVEDELAEGWPKARGASSLSWDEAAPIARKAWLHSREVAKHTLAGDSPDEGLQYRPAVSGHH